MKKTTEERLWDWLENRDPDGETPRQISDIRDRGAEDWD